TTRRNARGSRARMLRRRRSSANGAQTGSLLGPPALELERGAARVGSGWTRTLAVVGYPREVARGWLEPLLRAAGELDLALHVEPLAPALAADRLRRQRARLESTRRLERDRGALADPTVAAAAEDADELAARLARGESRLFRSGLYLSMRADSKEELQERTERVRALCASLLLYTVPTSFRSLDGWLSTLPLGLDRLSLRRAFDTEALAASFPFAAVDPPAEETGILYGLAASGAPVLLDRFARENYNSVLLARSGAGKSYLAKLEALRLLFRGVQAFVLDPEGEYRRLTEAVGGAYLPLAGKDAVALNPLDLAGSGGSEALAERILFLAEPCELLLGGLTERLKPPAIWLALDAIWRQLEGPLHRRCVLVDEAWLLMREPAGARFLFRLAKSARKRWCGLTAITQDAPDLLGSELGQAV